MPRRCTICAHPERPAIDSALVAGRSFRNIAEQFRLIPASVYRHKQTHLPAALVRAQDAQETAHADSLLTEVRSLHHRTLEVLRRAEASGEVKTVLMAVREARANVELLAKLVGELREGTTVNVLVLPEWAQARSVLMEALLPFPDARVAVAAALRRLGGEHGAYHG